MRLKVCEGIRSGFVTFAIQTMCRANFFEVLIFFYNKFIEQFFVEFFFEEFFGTLFDEFFVKFFDEFFDL